MRILQCLNWDLRIIEQNLEKMKEQGFDIIQVTPVQPLKEKSKDNWWLCYQPCGFRIGNQYGSKNDLINLCKKAESYDLKIVVDVVCTHTEQGTKLMPHYLVDVELISNIYLWREKINLQESWEYNNRYNITHYCVSNLPGLNLYNWDLQNIIIRFLNECISCGVAGFKFGFGQNIPLPTDSFEYEKSLNLKDSRGCDFFPRVLSSLDRQDLINYIEVLNVDANLIKKYSEFAKVLTNVEYDCLDKNTLITFAESHDGYFNWRPGVVSPLSDSTISRMYEGKNSYYPNTLYYSRPFSNEWQTESVKRANYQKVRKI